MKKTIFSFDMHAIYLSGSLTYGNQYNLPELTSNNFLIGNLMKIVRLAGIVL